MYGYGSLETKVFTDRNKALQLVKKAEANGKKNKWWKMLWRILNLLNNSLQASLSSLIKVKTVTGTTNDSGNFDLQTKSSVKMISAVCKTSHKVVCEIHLNADKTQWFAYLHNYDEIGAQANKTNTVDVYYIE